MLARNKSRAFSLIELLVVITILAIISVVAYTKFGWSTDAAKNSKKLSDIASIETWLQMFYKDKNYYPMPSQYNATKNVWWYDSTKTATVHNTLVITKSWDQIATVTSWAWWWKVYESWSVANQIWAKWTIDSTIWLTKEYLSQELADPSVKDIKVGNNSILKDYWVGEYVYWVYAKNNATWDSTSTKWSAYNIAITLKDDQKGYLTKLTWDFWSSTCVNCPNSLIWDWTSNNSLNDGDNSFTWSVTDSTDRTPYPLQF